MPAESANYLLLVNGFAKSLVLYLRPLTESKDKDIPLPFGLGSGIMAANRRIFFFLAASLVVFPARAPVAQSRADVRIVTNVELVQIPVIVFDDKGAVAINLKKDDFRVLDNGVEQHLLYCERERQSVSFVILADQSSSMASKMPFVQEAAISVLDPDLTQDAYRDEFSVFGIGTRVKRLVPFTSDEQDIERRLPLLLTPTNESTDRKSVV